MDIHTSTRTETPDDGLLVCPADISADSPIKVIGVGGGGGNAVANMFREGIEGVQFLVCNSDSKALESSPVPEHLQIGPGLGCGGDPTMGSKYAEESLEQIGNAFGKDTQMVFITAGMGGGTGTGASPVIAREARKRGILTVGIVTIPFLFELTPVIDKALDGLERLAEEVDALLVINNERLKDIYNDLDIINAFHKADDILTVAARSIVEIIHMRGIMNLDFTDVYNTLHDGGVAIISTGNGAGDRRITQAIEEAIKSPLLNNNDIYNATHFVMRITFNEAQDKSLRVDELQEIDDFMSRFNPDLRTKWGFDIDPDLGDSVKVTILASGFGLYGRRKKARKQQEEREKEARTFNYERIGNFYPENKRAHRRTPHTFEFDTDDLENEALIELVESVPTYRRKRNELERIRNEAHDL